MQSCQCIAERAIDSPWQVRPTAHLKPSTSVLEKEIDSATPAAAASLQASWKAPGWKSFAMIGSGALRWIE